MNKYQSFKDSGVEWIGEIPSHWKLTRIGYISKLLTGNPWKSDQFDFDEGIKIVRGENVSEGFLRWGKRARYWKQDVESDSPFFLDEGDIIIGMDGSKVGKNYVQITQGDLPLLLHQRMCRIRLNDIHSSDLISFWIGSEMFRYYIDVSKTDPMIPHITQRNIYDFKVPVPTTTELRAMVSFLKTKTNLIDNLIQHKEQKIDLLKEKRTSLINHAVTKGLNPNVELKDSGVEWIGEIPVHWEHKPLKYVVESNRNTLTDKTNPDYALNYVEISDVDSYGAIHNSTPYLFKDSPSRCRRVLTKGDVFISTVRTYLRSIGYVNEDAEDLICSTGFCVLTPSSAVLTEFLYYMVSTEWFIGEVISKSVGVSYPSITSTDLMDIKGVFPPVKEQEKIVCYLSERISEIDVLVNSEYDKIHLLTEYRKSLISEVVTGKVRVCQEDNSLQLKTELA